MYTTRINSPLTTHPTRGGKTRCHKLPKCLATGLPRFRDRHQARDAARIVKATSSGITTHTYPCADCGGHHIEKSPVVASTSGNPSYQRSTARALTQSPASTKRRYVLVDIENLTVGGKKTRQETAAIWGALHGTLLGVTDRDHVVVGAALAVHRKYRREVCGLAVKWVVGAADADGADRALLGAIDIVRVAREYDELVIASGDHAFTPLASRASQLGLSVHVVHADNHGHRSTLSRSLARVADTRSLIGQDLRITTQHNHSRVAIAQQGQHRGHDVGAYWNLSGDHFAAA